MSAVFVGDFRVYRFHPERLDPITVFIERIREDASRITVQCYARAWTAYWGSHGNNSVEAFILSCHAQYVANSLTWGLNGLMVKRQEKHDYAYLIRIVEAIQNHFKEHSDTAEQAKGE